MNGGGVFSISWRNSHFLRFALILLLAFVCFFLILTFLHLWNFKQLEKDINRREIERLHKGVTFVLNKEEWGVKNFLQSLLWNKELYTHIQRSDSRWLSNAFEDEMMRPFASVGVINKQKILLYGRKPIFNNSEDLQDLFSFLQQTKEKENLCTFYWRHRGDVYLVGAGSLSPGEEQIPGGMVYLAKELNKGYLVGLRHFSEGEIEIFTQLRGEQMGLPLRDWRRRPVAWISIRPSPYFVSLFVAMQRVYLWHSLFILLVFALTTVLFALRLREKIVREFNKIIDAFEKLHQGVYPHSQSIVKTGDEFGAFALQIQKVSQTLSQLLTTDPLTKIYNRTYFYNRLKQEIYRAQRYKHSLALIILDLDNFKDVNDKLGHQAGDQLLRDVAPTLKDTLRKSDILARWGGEEFAIILPETGAKRAMEVAERIRWIIESLPLDYQGEKVGCTASLGIAVLKNGEGEENLIRRADQMLYRAKENGKNQVAIAEA